MKIRVMQKRGLLQPHPPEVRVIKEPGGPVVGCSGETERNLDR